MTKRLPPPKGLFDRPARSPRETLAPLTVRELAGLLMTPFLYEFTSLRLRVLACTLDDVRDELRRRECMVEAVS